MRILLTGCTGGIGSAIKESLSEHDVTAIGRPEFLPIEPFDWIIFAHGFIGENDIIRTFEANLFSCIMLFNHFLPELKKGVIFISSTAAIGGNGLFPLYSASKGAINSYAKSLAKKHPEYSFYSVCPGPTDTPMWRKLGLEGKAQAPEEVASVVKDILNGEFKSGTILTVRDGKVTV